MELPLEVVAVAQGPGAIDGVDGEDVPRGAPAPEVAAPAAVAVPDVVVVGHVEGRGDGGAPAPEVAAEVGRTIIGLLLDRPPPFGARRLRWRAQVMRTSFFTVRYLNCRMHRTFGFTSLESVEGDNMLT